jgi:hypothetical protein
VTTQLDSFVGMTRETAFGAYMAPSKFLTFTDESLDQKFTWNDATGLRPGRRTTAAFQRTLERIMVDGDVTMEANTAEQGIIWESLLGARADALVAGGTATYQHLYTPAADYLPSYTIQKGIPPLGGGPLIPFTFLGMQCKSLVFDAKIDVPPTIKATFDGQNIYPALTGSGVAATPVYPTANELLTYVGGSITVGGTVTPPTGTTLATGGTSVAQIVDASVTFDNALDSGGITLGGGGARTRALASLLTKISGTLTAEFRDASFWNAYNGAQRLALVLNFQGSITEAALNNYLQIYVPIIVLDGEMPKIKAGSIVTQSLGFTGLQDTVNSLNPFYVVQRNKIATY